MESNIQRTIKIKEESEFIVECESEIDDPVIAKTRTKRENFNRSYFVDGSVKEEHYCDDTVKIELGPTDIVYPKSDEYFELGIEAQWDTNKKLEEGLQSPAKQKKATNNSGSKENFQCGQCLKKFTRKSSLKNHLVVHTGEKPFTCPTCSEAFAFASSLRKHASCTKCPKKRLREPKKRLHEPKQPYQCQVCLKVFTRRDSLVDHTRIHTGDTTYQCHICFKTFTQNRSLVYHVKVHEGSFPFRCTSCPKTFPDEKSLLRHGSIHEVKTFVCELCPQTFTRRTCLTNHVRMHQRPLECSVCFKSFPKRRNLMKHRQVHAGRSFPCDLCDKGFSRRTRLRAHMKIAHE